MCDPAWVRSGTSFSRNPFPECFKARVAKRGARARFWKMKQSKRYRKAVSQIRWQEDPSNPRLSSLTSSLHLHCWLCWLYWPPAARPTSRYPGSAACRWLLRPDSRCPSWPSPWTSQWLVPSQSRLGGQTSQVLGFSIQVHLKMCKMCVAFLNYFRMYLECRGLKTTDILFIFVRHIFGYPFLIPSLFQPY